MPTYTILRKFQRESIPSQTIKTGLTLEEAQEHCADPETSSKTAKGSTARRRTEQCGPWFDAYTAEEE